MMKLPAQCLAILLWATPALAQDGTSFAEGGRWVPAGTFALSNLPNNEVRQKSYSGAARERGRLATYLPGMTIVYQAKPSEHSGRSGYIEGVTHSGIPVSVLDEDLSTGFFNDRQAKDVVIHQSHEACRNLACDTDKVLLGIGFSFSIVHEDSSRIELRNADDIKITYSINDFDELERRGVLTRHKDRSHPRWAIYDGYAEGLSVGCGETRTSGPEVEVPAQVFEGSPSAWGQNDPAWSLKAMQIFGLGHVQRDNSGPYIGRLTHDIEDPLGGNVAIDFTVFAYRDSQVEAGNYKFAGIIQKVNCESLALGNLTPTYAKSAFLYFDNQESEEYPQAFPLEEFELPRQLSEKAQAELFGLIGRSFYYSVNSPREYARIFDLISDENIRFPIATANVIARINASCRSQDRRKCEDISSRGIE